ncbi:hypothetical protein ACHAPJ_012571 [Fusarium lateritium]
MWKYHIVFKLLCHEPSVFVTHYPPRTLRIPPKPSPRESPFDSSSVGPVLQFVPQLHQCRHPSPVLLQPRDNLILLGGPPLDEDFQLSLFKAGKVLGCPSLCKPAEEGIAAKVCEMDVDQVI